MSPGDGWDFFLKTFFRWNNCLKREELEGRMGFLFVDKISCERSFMPREKEGEYQFISSNEHSTNDPCFRRSNVRIFSSFLSLSLARSLSLTKLLLLLLLFPSLSLSLSLSLSFFLLRSLSPVQRIINTALECRMIDSYANRNLIIERCIHAKLIVLTSRQKKYEKTRLSRKGVGGKRGNWDYRTPPPPMDISLSLCRYQTSVKMFVNLRKSPINAAAAAQAHGQ